MIKRITKYFGSLLIIITLMVLVGCSLFKGNNLSVDVQNIEDVLTYLSSDELKGRLTGTPGNEKAVEYIVSKYKEYGLKSPSGIDGYKQYYDQRVRKVNNVPKLELVNNEGEIIKNYKYIYDFGLKTHIENGKIKGEETAQTFIMDETRYYSSEEVTNKFGLVTAEVSNKYDSFSDLHKETSGSYGIIVESSTVGTASSTFDYFPVGTSFSRYIDNENGQMTLIVTPTVFQEIKTETENGAKVHISLDCSIDDVTTENVVGYIEGSNSKLKDEYLLITAHLDHVGSNGDGTYNPGTLDNASGIAGLLEIARIISLNKNLAQKTIVFIAFNGEEEGLYGSDHYVNNPIFPLEKTTVINLDMIGSSEILPLTFDYCDTDDSDLREKLDELGKENSLDMEYGLKSGASDHIPFCFNNVPAVTLINYDIENGLHSPNDDLNDVDVERLKEIVDFLVSYIDQEA